MDDDKAKICTYFVFYYGELQTENNKNKNTAGLVWTLALGNGIFNSAKVGSSNFVANFCFISPLNDCNKHVSR